MEAIYTGSLMTNVARDFLLTARSRTYLDPPLAWVLVGSGAREIGQHLYAAVQNADGSLTLVGRAICGKLFCPIPWLRFERERKTASSN
jgi:hypothetical protein